MNPCDRFRGCLLGLAVGDAVGTAVEFRPRGSFPPLTDMVGGGAFGLLPGQWTDDTSMALCLATSLVECGGFDADDQMRRYCRWMDEGYLNSTGVSFYANPEAAERLAGDSSRTTHGAAECIDACRLMARILCRALCGEPRDSILFADAEGFAAGERIKAIARGTYRDKAEADIRGSGYVVESLEAALWAFSRTESYAEAILMAANLGDDADTTAAVCGQVAGAYYGEQGIPARWLEPLVLRAEIAQLADALGGKR